MDPPRLRIVPDLDRGEALPLGLGAPLAAALAWGSGPAPYASTVDVDAIKVG